MSYLWAHSAALPGEQPLTRAGAPRGSLELVRDSQELCWGSCPTLASLPRGTHWEGTLAMNWAHTAVLGLGLGILGALGRAADVLGGHTGLNFVFPLLNIDFPFHQGRDKGSARGDILFFLLLLPPRHSSSVRPLSEGRTELFGSW